MSAQDSSIEVTDPADEVVYVFATEDDHEEWALTGEPTWAQVRPATAGELAETFTDELG